MADPRWRNQKNRLETSILAAKLAVLLIGILSIALIARISVPYSVGLLASALPRLWSAVRGCLVPPYLFITVHLIILTIWKLSEQKLQRDHRPEEEKSPDGPLLPAKPKGIGPSPTIQLLQKPSPEIWHGISPYPADSGGDRMESESPVPALESGGSMPEPSSSASCLTTESDEDSTASSRLDIKKSIKPTTMGIEPIPEEGDDTMEARWKAIMEGGATPAVRQLRTSGTRGRSSRPEPEPEFAVAAGGWRSEAAWRREREGSGLGHEEWDRRFESFIKKNYEQIRLQRQETAHPDG